MPSQFVEHYTLPLTQYAPSTSAKTSVTLHSEDVENVETPAKERLRALLLALEQDLSHTVIEDAIHTLGGLDKGLPSSSLVTIDVEEETLERAVMTKLVIALYSESLDIYLTQSVEVENEAEWWADVERSRQNVAWYLLQTLPLRVTNLMRTILDALRANNLPFRPSQFTPTSLRRLFPSAGALRPSTLTTSLFPHLRHDQQLLPFGPPSLLMFSLPRKSSVSANGLLVRVTSSFASCMRSVWVFLTLPFELTQQECRFKRKELEDIRDQRANILGKLAQKRVVLLRALEDESVDTQRRMFYRHLRPFAWSLKTSLSGLPEDTHAAETLSLLDILQDMSYSVLPECNSSHSAELQQLYRPSRFVQMWPKLLLLPPLAIYAASSIYSARTDLLEIAKETAETVKGFVVGWLIEPLREVLNTVRARGDDGVIIRKEGVIADLDSLERMTLSLAQDKLHYSPEQLATLSQQIRVGDLTPVLKLYEEDIRSPLKSAITGTLLRSVFIQVQKAKVDLDQALTGIDKLLKSQELTFAFVGVAPALSIVYLFGGYLARVWSGGRGRGRFGGKYKRAGVMFTMRRIERLLTSDTGVKDVSPLTAGLLVLSVAHLRSYGEECLPSRTRLKEGFLEDVGDLEDPALGRREKRAVVERMWRSWGKVLGWNKVAGEGVAR